MFGYNNLSIAKKYINAIKVELLNALGLVDQKADSVQLQLNQAVIEGDSSVEAAQARVDANDKTYDSLKDRLDTEQARMVENEKRIILSQRASGQRQCVVSFIDDDGYDINYQLLKPIFEDAGVPYCMALITDYNGQITDEHMAEAAAMGWEFCSHTYNHQSLVSLTAEEIDFQLRKSKEMIEAKGYKCNAIVYPFGDHNATIRKIAMKYYKFGFGANANLNTFPVKTYAMNRVPLGSDYHPNYPNTLERYKKMFDIAYAQKTWVIYMLHASSPSFDETQQQHLVDLIDYIKSFDVPILTVSEAFKLVGNMHTVGDGQNEKLVITNSGDLFQSSMYEEVESNTNIWKTGTGENQLMPIGYVDGGNVKVELKATGEIINPRIVSTGASVWGGLKAAEEIIKKINNPSIATYEVYDGKRCLKLVGDFALQTALTSQPFLPNTQYVLNFQAIRGAGSTSSGGKLKWKYTDGEKTTALGPVNDTTWEEFNMASSPDKTIECLYGDFGSTGKVTYIDIDSIQLVLGGSPPTSFSAYKDSYIEFETTLQANDVIVCENGRYYINATEIPYVGKLKVFKNGQMHVLPSANPPVVKTTYPLNQKASDDIADELKHT